MRTGRGDLEFDAVLFDLDGVVTRTASLHAAAWAELFDDFLRRRAAEGGEPFRPFDPTADYLAHVDGKPRSDGVRSFLAARGIALPEGAPTDQPEAATVHGLGGRKDALFMVRLRRDGVEVFAATIALIRALRERGVKTAVVSSSHNGRELLRTAGIEELFDVRLDGLDAEALGVKGKPDPDPFLKGAELLGVTPGRAVVIEDATAGVEAGRRGGFGLVVGVDRGGNREALIAHGADLVVADLGEVSVDELDARRREKQETVAAWRIEQEGFDPAREHAVESLFTVGNGYLGVRGALDTPLPGSQGDVLLHLFPEAFPREVVAASYRYYEPITDHGSSLSPGIHAAVAARLGLREDAERYWRESLWLDLSDVMTNSALGVHPACMGATWQALVLGVLGVRFTDAGPVADPGAGGRLPAKWRAVSLALTCSGWS